MVLKTVFSPYVYHTTKTLPIYSREQRAYFLETAGLNVFNLNNTEITIDLFTDSGGSACSIDQMMNINIAKEECLGIGQTYKLLCSTLKQVFNYSFFNFFLQGRTAEYTFNKFFLNEKKFIVCNNIFSTTQYHQQAFEAENINISCAEAFNEKSKYPFKGNISISALKEQLNIHKDEIAYINIELCSNAIGGYATSLKNIQQVYEISNIFNIPVVLDSTRILENAKMIQIYEEGFNNKTIKDIVLSITECSDFLVMSLKKDFLTPIGGMIATNNQTLYKKIMDHCILHGSEIPTGHLAAIEKGVQEAILNESHMTYRYELTRRLYQGLQPLDLGVIEPLACHGVWINVETFMKKFYEFSNPAIALQNSLFIEGGIRTGISLFNGKPVIRLAIPHRLYTESHIDYVVDVIDYVYKNQHLIKDVIVQSSGNYLVDETKKIFVLKE